MKVLVSLLEDPEGLRLRYIRTLSLQRGGSPPVLMDGMNAVYVGPRWTCPIAESFASIRSPMPMPVVVDWDDDFIERILARMEEQGMVKAADLDHESRGW